MSLLLLGLPHCWLPGESIREHCSIPGTEIGTEQLEVSWATPPPQDNEQALPQHLGVSSASLLDEAVEVVSNSPPLEDYRGHWDLLRRMFLLDIQVEEIHEKSHRLEILASAAPFRVALLINEVILEPVKVFWQTPSPLPPSMKLVEQWYYDPSKGFEHPFSHPPLGSLVVPMANEWQRWGSRHRRQKE